MEVSNLATPEENSMQGSLKKRKESFDRRDEFLTKMGESQEVSVASRRAKQSIKE